MSYAVYPIIVPSRAAKSPTVSSQYSSSDSALRQLSSDNCSSRSEENQHPSLNATQVENGQVNFDFKHESIPYVPVWQQCGLYPPKRIATYRKPIDLVDDILNKSN
ncbi:hypothetical protein PENTCL1PPCAC_11739 [Pristionchus entomophagus]|uniref:Uncharacterized protein n=1 Tax=Pristionchus entomophagus TaxID=358040 RepID=A0AAV5T7B1_9BILA|nr:hypothetical protein PENTCL1PPCAC_11739 [Pristionchus entomophagus]